jgi:hypothetical protein
MHHAIPELRRIALTAALIAGVSLVACERKPAGQAKDGQDSQATAAGPDAADTSGEQQAGDAGESRAGGAGGAAHSDGAEGGDGGGAGGAGGGPGAVPSHDPGGAVGGQIRAGSPEEGGAVRGEARARDDAATRQTRSELVGRWKQVEGGNDGDFAEGGYASNELTFDEAGVLIIARSFDDEGSVRLRRQLTWTLDTPDELALDKAAAEKQSAAITRDTAIPTANGGTATIHPPQTAPPATVRIRLAGKRLEIAGKTYEKQSD